MTGYHDFEAADRQKENNARDHAGAGPQTPIRRGT